ncbi:MAG: beta-galactosidase [Spirochaetia bacterium]|jgi:beta-galactosidase|nr:beta-galactosidase [Spirochaetia bacterium]
MNKEKTLDFGVDWYPEQWSEQRWQEDARRIAGYGFDCVRIMEFAWSILEPEPGRFDFSLFDRAIAVLAAAGLDVILGTPTATPPQWLRDEPVFRVSANGARHEYGTRRNVCYNAPAYMKAARRVVNAVADHYGSDDRIIGFQVDNEIGHEGSDRCVCEHCKKAWPLWLSDRYGTIEALNDAWGAVFWNTSYARFDQVPVASIQPSTVQNPALVLDYDRFCSESAERFAQEQTVCLRAKASPGHWITTNLFPPPLSNTIDMEALSDGMDFVSWDNYPVWGDQDEPLPWQFNATAQAYVRGLRDGVPFTVMEEMSGFQGHVCLGYLPPERRVALWAVQAIARGANRIVFFRWRTAPYGQEQLCYGLLDSDNRETERLRVIKSMMDRAKKELSSLAATKVDSPVCVAYSKDDARLLREQYLSKGLCFRVSPTIQAGYDREAAAWFAPYATLGIGADISSTRSIDMDRYKVISLPLYQMADPVLVERLGVWVDSGGTLVLGYRAGARDTRNNNIDMPLPGLFSELAGLTVPRFESLNMTSAKLRVGLVPGRGNVWADIIEPETAVPVATWTDREKFYRGFPAATVNRVGKGRVWYIGTSPDPLAMLSLYRRILKEAGLAPRFAGGDIESILRSDSEGRTWRLVLNHSPVRRWAYGVRLAPWGWAKLPMGR